MHDTLKRLRAALDRLAQRARGACRFRVVSLADGASHIDSQARIWQAQHAKLTAGGAA